MTAVMNANAEAVPSLPGQSEQKNCSSCGASFGCGANSAEGNCWCYDLPPVSLVAAADQDCLCPDCLARAIAKPSATPDDTAPPAANTSANTSPLIEGEDYYCEGAAMVFTAQFLLRRGYCCESGCRHCPYPKGARED
jgi:hypothetical protein